MAVSLAGVRFAKLVCLSPFGERVRRDLASVSRDRLCYWGIRRLPLPNQFVHLGDG